MIEGVLSSYISAIFALSTCTNEETETIISGGKTEVANTYSAVVNLPKDFQNVTITNYRQDQILASDVDGTSGKLTIKASQPMTVKVMKVASRSESETNSVDVTLKQGDNNDGTIIRLPSWADHITGANNEEVDLEARLNDNEEGKVAPYIRIAIPIKAGEDYTIDLTDFVDICEADDFRITTSGDVTASYIKKGESSTLNYEENGRVIGNVNVTNNIYTSEENRGTATVTSTEDAIDGYYSIKIDLYPKEGYSVSDIQNLITKEMCSKIKKAKESDNPYADYAVVEVTPENINTIDWTLDKTIYNFLGTFGGERRKLKSNWNGDIDPYTIEIYTEGKKQVFDGTNATFHNPASAKTGCNILGEVRLAFAVGKELSYPTGSHDYQRNPKSDALCVIRNMTANQIDFRGNADFVLENCNTHFVYGQPINATVKMVNNTIVGDGTACVGIGGGLNKNTPEETSHSSEMAYCTYFQAANTVFNFEGNTLDNSQSIKSAHTAGIQGFAKADTYENQVNQGVTNSITMTNNTFKVTKNTQNANRVAFKMWEELSYTITLANGYKYTDNYKELPAAAKTLVDTFYTNGNTVEKLDGQWDISLGNANLNGGSN